MDELKSLAFLVNSCFEAHEAVQLGIKFQVDEKRIEKAYSTLNKKDNEEQIAAKRIYSQFHHYQQLLLEKGLLEKKKSIF